MKKTFVRISVAGFVPDIDGTSLYVILKETYGRRVMAIVIGVFEADAIVKTIHGIHFPRPLTHDLLQNILTSAGAQVSKGIITSLELGMCCARLYVKQGEKEYNIDSRPSDAITMCLKFDAPVYVEEGLLEEGDRDIEEHNPELKRMLFEPGGGTVIEDEILMEAEIYLPDKDKLH
jgi:bifunctional DNase/RNase